MKRGMLSRAVYLLLLLSCLASCKSKRAAVAATLPVIDSISSGAVGTPTETLTARSSIAEKLVAVNDKRASFTTLSAKAKAALSIGKNSNDVTMNIRIKNDQVIWVSITAIAGLEVARAMITPDSVKVINRLENEYIKKPFSYLYEFTNNKIKFGTLQAVLVGNAIPEFLDESTELSLSGTQSELRSVIGSLIYNLLLNDQNKVVQANLSDRDAGQSLVVSYGDFQNVLQQRVPHSINMKSQAKSKNISVDLNFSKIELDVPVDIPFRAPDRYTIKN